MARRTGCPYGFVETDRDRSLVAHSERLTEEAPCCADVARAIAPHMRYDPSKRPTASAIAEIIGSALA